MSHVFSHSHSYSFTLTQSHYHSQSHTLTHTNTLFSHNSHSFTQLHYHILTHTLTILLHTYILTLTHILTDIHILTYTHSHHSSTHNALPHTPKLLNSYTLTCMYSVMYTLTHAHSLINSETFFHTRQNISRLCNHIYHGDSIQEFMLRKESGKLVFKTEKNLDYLGAYPNI